MSRVSLLDAAPRPRVRVDAPAQDTAALLRQMQCVMRGFYNQGWDARAAGCSRYANGPTPDEAMRMALALLNEEGNR